MQKMTHAEWKAEGQRRFGTDPLEWQFVCPSCGHVASVKDWKTAGAPEGAVAFSCVGRYTGDGKAAADKAFKHTGGPCNYTGGGLFRLNPVEVDFEDGSEPMQAFAFAELTPNAELRGAKPIGEASRSNAVLGAVPPEPTFTEKDMNETTWKKEPAIEGKHGGCLNCGPRPSFFPPDGVIAVGFGYAGLHRDGEPIYTEPNNPEGDDEYMTGAKAEELAAADPDHDWRIVMDGPLSGRTYQRHAAGEWALIEQNQGFA